MTLSLSAAFFAGVLSFLSPCVLPLVPTYLLYLGGQKGRRIFNAIFFVLGFGAIFMLLGLPFTLLGSALKQHQILLGRGGGVLLILFGLYMLGLKPAILVRGVNLSYRGDTTKPWGAFVLGAVLGLGWTPCIGPILGGILTLTAQGGGVGFLATYILGLAVPFLLVAMFAERATRWLRRTAHIAHWAERIAGVALLLAGILLFSGSFTKLNIFFNRIVPSWLQERL